HGETAEGIADVAVEAGRHQHELGRELPTDRDDHLGEGAAELLVSEAGGGRGGGRATGSGTPPRPPWTPRPGVARGRVRGAREHVGITLEEVLRAVPVVQVPVDDDDATDPATSQMRGGDRDVVEEAEAHCASVLGMMPGRADQGDAVVDLARADRITQL